MVRLGTTVTLSLAVLLLSGCVGLQVGDVCENTSECPTNTECEVSPCIKETSNNDPHTCNCKAGYYPLDNKQGCAIVVDLNRECDEYRVCRQDSYCKNSRCKCLDGYLPSWDNRRCKPHLPGSSKDNPTYMAAFGEPCSSEVRCYDQFGYTECVSDRCRCKEGYRPRAKTDRISNPIMAGSDCLPTSAMNLETADFC